MSEHMSPIPSRLYNAAVGGHVAGADQIIDDETGLTLDKVTGGALEEKEYTSGSDNGMGRVVLRKNLVEGVNTLTQAMINKNNTIYVIQYDFTLASDVTIPANCVLEFDGGSLSNGTISCDTAIDLRGVPKLLNIALESDITNSYIVFGLFETLQKDIDYCIAYNKNLDLNGNTISVDSPLVINRQILTTDTIFNFVISNGTFICNNENGVLFTSTINRGADLPDSWYLKFENVVFTSTKDSDQPYVLDRGKFVRVNFDSCSFVRFRLTVADGANEYLSSIYLLNCIIQYIDGYFLRTKKIYQLYANNVNMQTSFNGRFAYIEGCFSVKISNCVFENMLSVLFYVVGAGLVIENNYFEDIKEYIAMSDYKGENVDIISKGVAINNNFIVKTDLTSFFCFIWPSVINGVCVGNCIWPAVTDWEKHLNKYNNSTYCDIIEKKVHSVPGIPKLFSGNCNTEYSKSAVFSFGYVEKGSFVINSGVQPGGYVPNIYVCTQEGIYDNDSAKHTAKFSPISILRGTTAQRPIASDNASLLRALPKGLPYFDSDLAKPIWAANVLGNGTGIWVRADGARADVKDAGTFAEKPTSNMIYIGFRYFCTDRQTAEGATDGIVIYHKGNNVWVDALGRVVS